MTAKIYRFPSGKAAVIVEGDAAPCDIPTPPAVQAVVEAWRLWAWLLFPVHTVENKGE